ncbi:OmpA family protein [Reyranella sp. CPCC 100927]|uniref:OmpA family protein n=1 Tax=Reyranella sp. CPCC 100927 TaxID=2599616 RepID=UPI0011B3D3FD|nr:OmpA family protein [Reyranella sp. CPCC 100927]TWT10118.1 OmpA family protein [Reyranella sp. CPCC 100927]
MKAKLGAIAAATLVAAPLAANAQTVNMPGFYVGLAGGANFMNFSTLGKTKEKVGFAAGGVVGYDLVGPRVELEFLYRQNKNKGVGKNMYQYTPMVNVLYDFIPDSMITPYLGVGAGVNFWEYSHVSTQDLAVQGIAGIGLRLADGFFANLDYRFMNTFAKGKDFRNHTALVTLGYKFGAPAPAAAPPPVPSTPTTQYIVFFDFDRATLTAQAQATIKQAADAAKSGNRTRVGVTGHADRAGGDAYNMALSLRRANAVKDALVREGIPATGITVVGRGESQPLVPTADGVREPQNRRVEIVLQ